MPSIAIWSFKGGVGKTTLAMHLAAKFAQTTPTALFDLDPQGSSTDLGEAMPYTVIQDERKSVLNASPEQWAAIRAKVPADMVVCEYPPAVPGVQLAGRYDCIVIPMMPSRIDYLAALRGLASLENPPPVVLVLNRFKAHITDHKEIKKALEAKNASMGHAIVTVPDLSAFVSALNQGTTIYDVRGVSSLTQARQAVDDLAAVVLKQLKGANHGKNRTI